MRPGALILYKLSWHGIPLRWKTEIVRWEPTSLFVDNQLSGPYSLWHHTHTFKEERGGTLMTDVVRYALPFGPLGRLAHWLTVRRNVEQIFDYRYQKVESLFG
jgi:ligand-binding SRPBCC domain-containing protein